MSHYHMLSPADGERPAPRPPADAQPYRSPLTRAACTCGTAPQAVCAACARWRRYAAEVAARMASRTSGGPP